jgi:hypothetical protein
MSSAFDNGHWRFPKQLDYLKAHGFVYLVREMNTGQFYIGRKNFRSEAKATIGKQLDWRTYLSSSKKLQEKLEKMGLSKFEFYVLDQYYSKGGVGWAETWSQAFAATPVNPLCINRIVEGVTWKSTEDITPLHRERIREFLSGSRPR